MSVRPLLLATALLVLTPSCAAGPAPPAGKPARAPAPRIHVVAAGETLWRIARRYGLSVEELARLNGISDPDRISVGQRLRLPPGAAPAPPPQERPAIEVPREWRWPVRGPVSSGFGEARRRGRHQGIDILVPPHTPVLAARDGVVRFAGRRRGYGLLVVIEHDGEFTSWYGHNSRLTVREGERVREGEQIAWSGSTGNASAPHVHFELRRKERPLDPLTFLPGR